MTRENWDTRLLAALYDLENATRPLVSTGTNDRRDVRAQALNDAMVAAVKASYPGYQSNVNFLTAIKDARKAFLRSLRSATKRAAKGAT